MKKETKALLSNILKFGRTLGFHGGHAKTSLFFQLPVGNSWHPEFQIWWAALKVLSPRALFADEEAWAQSVAERLVSECPRQNLTGPLTVAVPARILSRAGPKHSVWMTEGRTHTAVPFPSPTARAGGRARGRAAGPAPAGPPWAAPSVPHHRPGPGPRSRTAPQTRRQRRGGLQVL